MRVHLMATVLAAALIGAGCGGSGTPAKSKDTQPLRIAVIPPLSGALASYGKDAKQAVQYAVDEANAKGGVDGRHVEVVNEETDGTPAATVRAAQSAAQRDNAKFIMGVFTSPEHAALQQQLVGIGAISINTIGKDDGLTGANCSLNAFRLLQSTGMDLRGASQLLTTLPTKSWSIMAVDYSTGHDAADLFKAGLQKQGGTVVQTVYAPQGTSDFGSYITKLAQTPAEGLFIVEFGADAVTFLKQANQFDLLSKFKSVFGVNTVTTPLLPVLGPKITGMYDTLGYDPTVDVPANKQFVASWQAKFGTLPYYVQADTYLGAQALFAAVKKAGTVDALKVRDTMSGLTFDSIVGKVTIRKEDHQILRPSYIGQVVAGPTAGSLAWKVVTEAPPSVTAPSPDPACHL